MDERRPVPAHLVPFWRLARPDLDPHRLWRFTFNAPPVDDPPRRSRRWYLAQLQDAVGTLESVLALLDFALPEPEPGEQLCEVWPGYWEGAPDHGVIALGDPANPPLKGLLKFHPITPEANRG